MYKIFLAMLILSMSVLSCRKDQPQPVSTASYFVKFSAGTKISTSNTVSAVKNFDNSITVNASANDTSSIVFTIVQNGSRYALQDQNLQYRKLSTVYFYLSPNPKFIEIFKHDVFNKVIQGAFSFKLHNLNDTTQTQNITGGSFNVMYQ